MEFTPNLVGLKKNSLGTKPSLWAFSILSTCPLPGVTLHKNVMGPSQEDQLKLHVIKISKSDWNCKTLKFVDFYLLMSSLVTDNYG
jgi:hypothetical protein